jgi:NADPH2:quinone reductase
MKAARLHVIGGTLQLDDIPEPVPGEGEVLIEVAYASVNPLDIWVTRGSPGAAAQHLPWIPGTEAAGWRDGEPVLVRGAGLGIVRHGLYRQIAAVPSGAVMPIPDDVDLAQAAAMPVVGITAWSSLHNRAGVTEDDRVLVLGASGGVGSVAVQLAKLAGATVWGHTGHAENAELILADGADNAVVSDADGFEAAVGPDFQPTVVIDALGGEWPDHAIAVMADRGRLVVYGTSDDENVTLNWRRMYRKGLTVLGYSGIIDTAESQQQVLSNLLDLMAGGELAIRLGAVLPLSEAAEAHARILERRARGKLVLDCRAI